MHADEDKQGLVQGMITGMRGLCNGLGPAMFGLLFSLFRVDLTEPDSDHSHISPSLNITNDADMGAVTHLIPGPPFVFGSLLVILALMVSAFIPDAISGVGLSASGGISGAAEGAGQSSAVVSNRRTYSLIATNERMEAKKSDDDDDSSDKEFTVPLIHSSGIAL